MSSVATVFYPSGPQAATNLKNATLFTRLNILAAPAAVSAMLDRNQQIRNTFCLGHYNDVLIFGTETEAHQENVRTVLQMLRDENTKANLRG